jgi:hypothetical protein
MKDNSPVIRIRVTTPVGVPGTHRLSMPSGQPAQTGRSGIGDPGHQRCGVGVGIVAARQGQRREDRDPEACAIEPLDPERQHVVVELSALRKSIVGHSGSTLPRSRKVVKP